ncbi:MAG: PEP-CTERM sorting domain-containing protein [Planctomycetes bacterium]|nr:PEP-CTERM sorting domain-containing protein [Planctomycetota bacterium]
MVALSLFLAALPTALAAAPSQFTIIDIGALGTGTGTSEGYGINNAGQVVGRTDPGDGTTHAFRWEGGVLTDMGAGPGDYALAEGINASGVACGFVRSGAPLLTNEAHTWDTAGSPYNLHALGGEWSEAYGLNDDAHVVGGAETAAGALHAFYWDGAGMQDLHPGGFESYAYGVNNAGTAVGGWGNWINDNGDPYTPCRWDGGVKADLADLGGIWGEAYGINEGGVIVGQVEAAGAEYHAVYWDGTGVHDIHPAFADTSLANSVNETGQIVGWYWSGGVSKAYLWDGSLALDLNTLTHAADAGWDLLEAWDINDQGWIVGYGTNPDGLGRAFLLVPEPATLTLLALGAAAAMWRRRRAY